MAEREVSFDSIARAYRWMEYAALGPALARTRRCFLPRLAACRRALVLGDGDGRFLGEMLRVNRRVRVDAVDASGAMLALLVRRTSVERTRVTAIQQDALDYVPRTTFDLIATHFFLDCLSDREVTDLVRRLAPRLEAGGLWVVSEFRVPEGAMALPARLYVGLLYRVFGLLTGLAVRRLPDYRRALVAAGLTCVETRPRLFGLLVSELWQAG